jgi:hypothetical protein
MLLKFDNCEKFEYFYEVAGVTANTACNSYYLREHLLIIFHFNIEQRKPRISSEERNN